MTGLLHFPSSTRRDRLSRRSLLAGAAGLAATNVYGRAAVAQAATPATPMATPDPYDARGRLASVLSYVPRDLVGGPDPNIPLFSWLDLWAHLFALGSPDLLSGEVDVVDATIALFIDEPLIRWAMDEGARETFGFSVFEVNQILVTGAPPDRLTLYAFEGPVDDLAAAWEGAGYERVAGDAGDFWTVGEEGELNLDSAAGQYAVGGLNNLAVLEGNVVVGAATSAMVQQVQAHVAGGGESAADDAEIQALVGSLPHDAVNVVAIRGEALEAHGLVPENPGRELPVGILDILAESDDAVGPMPPVSGAILGVTAGMAPPPMGNADAVFFAHLRMPSSEDAAQAATVSRWRVEHMTSPTTGAVYAELLTSAFEGEEAVAGEVAAMTFTGRDGVVPWPQMYGAQDLWPFVWVEEP